MSVDALTELDVRVGTPRWSFLYHVDPNPAVCIAAGPRPAAAGGGSIRKPGTLSSCEL